MSWNYRIMIRTCPETGSKYYSLNEVFYEKNGSHMAYSDHDDVVGGSPEEIIGILEMMLEDAKKDRPILTEADFKV